MNDWRVLFSLGCALWGCSSASSEPAPSAAEPARARAVAPEPLPAELALPAAPLVLAIGDLHGDLAVTRRALRLAGAIDQSDRWVGGTRAVVQTGDAIDRGDDDRAVLDLLERLRGEAKRAGGALIALSGNHELMNVAHDFRYVSPASFQAFESEGGRAEAFRPGGRYAAELAVRPIAVKVGDTLFAHGGILPKHVAYGLGRMHKEVQSWLRGSSAAPPALVMAEDGPIWTRSYSLPDERPACGQLAQVLSALGAKRMVVGHTVQPRGINPACDGRVWRIDVGMARVYGGPVQVLELRGEHVEVRAEGAELRAE